MKYILALSLLKLTALAEYALIGCILFFALHFYGASADFSLLIAIFSPLWLLFFDSRENNNLKIIGYPFSRLRNLRSRQSKRSEHSAESEHQQAGKLRE